MNKYLEVFEPNKAVDTFVSQLEYDGTIDPDLQVAIEQHMDRLEHHALRRIEDAMAMARAKQELANNTLLAMDKLQLKISSHNQATPKQTTEKPAADNQPEGFFQKQLAFFQDPNTSTGRKLLRASAIASGGYLLLRLSTWVKRTVTGSESDQEGFLSKFFRYTGLAFLASAGVSYLGEVFAEDTEQQEAAAGKDKQTTKNAEQEEQTVRPTKIVGPAEGTSLYNNEVTASFNGKEVRCSIGSDTITVNDNSYTFALTGGGALAARTVTKGGRPDKLTVFGAIWEGGSARVKAGLLYTPFSLFGSPKQQTHEADYKISAKHLESILQNGSEGVETFTVGLLEFTKR